MREGGIECEQWFGTVRVKALESKLFTPRPDDLYDLFSLDDLDVSPFQGRCIPDLVWSSRCCLMGPVQSVWSVYEHMLPGLDLYCTDPAQPLNRR